MQAGRQDFRRWYLGCTEGYFHEKKMRSDAYAILSQLGSLFTDFPSVANNILFLPSYLRSTHERYKQKKEAVIKGHKLKRGCGDEAFEGHVVNIFDGFEK